MNEKIYKIGKTKNLETLYSNHRNCILISFIGCTNSTACKKELLEEFNNKFIKHIIGKDYFIGNQHEMSMLSYNIVLKHMR